VSAVSTTPTAERDSLDLDFACLSLSPAVHLSTAAVLGFVMLLVELLMV